MSASLQKRIKCRKRYIYKSYPLIYLLIIISLACGGTYMAKKKKGKSAKPKKRKKVARKIKKAVKKREKTKKAKKASRNTARKSARKASGKAKKIAVVEAHAEGKVSEEEDYAGAPEEELPGAGAGESYEQPDYEGWEE